MESTNLADDATNVPVDKTINIVFATSMHPASINDTNITIAPSVPITVSLGADDKTAIIDPAENLSNNTEYTITVGTGVMGLYGWAKVPLAESYVLMFTSAA